MNNAENVVVATGAQLASVENFPFNIRILNSDKMKEHKLQYKIQDILSVGQSKAHRKSMSFGNMRREKLNDEMRGRIKGLREAGMTYRAIRAITGKSVAVISRCLRQLGRRKKQCGRPVALTERQTRRLVREACKTGSSASTLHKTCELPCNVRTTRRVLQRCDLLDYTKMQRTLPLTPAHKTARLKWAMDHAENPFDWSNIVFSDEKKFNLDGPDGYKNYWHDIRQPKRSFVTRQQGGGSVMVWGAIARCGKSALAILTGKQNSGDYVFTLSEYLLPFAHLKFGSDFVFQQDNAPIHTSAETKQFCADQFIDLLPWPARSPDLNPIENLWSTMSRVVYNNGRQYQNVAELRAAVLLAWDMISDEEVKNLIDSMHRRCLETIRRNGEKTHY
ncbi:hypothetical protein AaE_012241 [Aphanomyces astaci]|uniref:Tc1-like transposase DDE domain-containing protein n=1 Tax=Aphanomyces astaci TaxID=112090 RepID=A0A6A4ZH47_APHAT|nr:hypothetical protein AaE_012241 [Aphanomyces astaci]